MCCLSNEQSRNYSVITLSGTAWFPLALGRWRANQGPRSAKMSHFSSLCTKPASSFLGTAVDINCIAGCFPARCWRKIHSHKSSLGVFTLVGSKSLVLISETIRLGRLGLWGLPSSSKEQVCSPNLPSICGLETVPQFILLENCSQPLLHKPESNTCQEYWFVSALLQK